MADRRRAGGGQRAHGARPAAVRGTARGGGLPGRPGAVRLTRLHLPPGEVHSWCVPLDVPPETSAVFYATLTDEELERSARLRFERERRRFIVAHGALHD